MKKIAALFLLFTMGILAQQSNWTSVKETNINYNGDLSFDLFTNSYGNHIIVQENNALKYYKMGIDGQAGTAVTLESSPVVSPSICGDATKIYVVYRKSTENFIRTKYSLDGGTSWYSMSNLSQNGSFIESVASKNNLHLTYQIGNSVYYNYHPLTIGSWSTRYTVSSTETGTSPRIAAWADGNADEVWFIYRNSNTVGKFRKYNVSTGQWGPIRQGYSLNNIFSSSPLGFTVGNDWIYYYYTYTDLSFMIFFQYNVLTKDGGFISQSYPDPNQTYKVFTTTTVDGISHTSFYLSFLIEEEIGPGLYRQKNYQDDFYEPELFYQDDYLNEVYDPPVNLSSGGNEVHIVWKDNLGSNNGNNLRYIYYNQPPVVPQNLAISAYNDHPKLNWDRNPDADIDFYRIYKSKGGSAYQAYATVPDYLQEYVDNNETICNPPPGQECTNEEIASYKITAVDKTDPNALESDYSDEVKTSVIGPPPHKSIAGHSPELINEYKLSQNYPNPFNPSTSINYQVKDRGFVSLKVYDMLGREVAALVNETQDKGSYTVTFNAASLPSGVYIYSLRVNDFVQNNKMTLMK